MVTLFVPDLPEFVALVEASRQVSGCHVSGPVGGYWQIEAKQELRFDRRALGLKAALWNSALCGGFTGRIAEYGRDVLRIASGDD